MGSVVGELGSQRREIARTHDELASLAGRLERRAISFALPRNVRRQVGPVYVRLENVDIKDQHYTIRLVNGDTSTVLKDRAVNEVVRLYQDERSAPLELIVTHLNPNQATGTLILPAAEAASGR